MAKNNKMKVTNLKLKNKIKDFLIFELLAILTNNEIVIPKDLLEKINILYGDQIGEEKN